MFKFKDNFPERSAITQSANFSLVAAKKQIIAFVKETIMRELLTMFNW